MGRLIGIVAEKGTTLASCLGGVPNSLAWLPRDEPEGWGVAVHADDSRWKIHKGIARTRTDAQFEEDAATANGDMLLAHVRPRTAGRLRLCSPQPFHRDRWIFAHSGKIEGSDFLLSRSSARRVHQAEGETDSESFFAYLLSCLDVAGAPWTDASEAANRALTFALQEIVKHGPPGAYSFLLSDGRTLYAYRWCRPLFLLERSTTVGAWREPGSPQPAAAILVASEPLTDEPWRAVGDGNLLAITRSEGLRVRLLLGRAIPPAADSRPELPFTD